MRPTLIINSCSLVNRLFLSSLLVIHICVLGLGILLSALCVINRDRFCGIFHGDNGALDLIYGNCLCLPSRTIRRLIGIVIFNRNFDTARGVGDLLIC